MYREATSHTASSTLDCLDSAYLWAVEAKRSNNHSQLEAHIETLRLLAIAVSQGPSMEKQHTKLLGNKTIQQARGVAVEAAALALDRGRPELAVRLLEQGRGVIFRQLGRLRAEVEDIRLVVPELAEAFQSLSHRLEALAVSSSQVSSPETMRNLQAMSNRLEGSADKNPLNKSSANKPTEADALTGSSEYLVTK